MDGVGWWRVVLIAAWMEREGRMVRRGRGMHMCKYNYLRVVHN
jgi:hypothetical protein